MIEKEIAEEYYLKGLSYLQQGNFVEALKLINKALDLYPEYLKALLIKNELLKKLGIHKEARNSVEKMSNDRVTAKASSIKNQKRQRMKEIKAEKDPFKKGILLYKEKKYHEALKLFDKAIKENPNRDLVWYYKGVVLFDYTQSHTDLVYNYKKYEKIKEYLDRALELNPSNDKAWITKALVFELIGTYDETLKCCYEALKIQPNAYWLQTAYAHDRFKHYREAIECIDKALDYTPHNTQLHRIKSAMLNGLKYGDKYYVPIARSKLLPYIPPQEEIIYSTRVELIWHSQKSYVRGTTYKHKLITDILFTPSGFSSSFPILRMRSYLPRYINKSEARFTPTGKLAVGGYGVQGYRYKLSRVPFYESKETFKARKLSFRKDINF